MAALAEEAVAWATAHGLQMMTGEGATCTHAPLTLSPTPLAGEAFDTGVALAKPFNELVDRVARDLDWLLATLDGVGDPFTARLVKLCKEVEAEGVLQRAYLGINRSDYMMDQGVRLLQVELNTIASSFGCLSARVTGLHRFLLQRHGAPAGASVTQLPENRAGTAVPAALAAAAKLKHKQNGGEGPLPAVLFVVQEGERNSFDQRWLEYELWNAHGVRTLRRSLGQLAECAKLEGERRELEVDGERIGVVYFRAGYTPADYPTETQWASRTMLERSSAIKCPSVQYHLVGTKKVQQELARADQVERFMGAERGADLRKCFAGLWTLDRAQMDDDARAAVEDAVAHPDRYVVKPQREGGGNNLYGDQVREALTTMPEEELASYILMQRIFPKAVQATMLRRGEVVAGVEALQELGVYGTFLSDGTTVELNEQAGHLLRTKQVGVDEGGVATGFSCLDSPLLQRAA